MVVCMPLLSQVWGKYYIVKTKDMPEVSPLSDKSEAGVDYSDDEDNCETERLIHKHLTQSQLHELEELSPDNQGELIKSVDEVMDNEQNGKGGNDYNLDIVEHIKDITLGLENLLKGVNSFLRKMSELPLSKHNKSNKCNRKTRHNLKKSKEYKICKSPNRCKNSKGPKDPRKYKGKNLLQFVKYEMAWSGFFEVSSLEF